jgi:hypothetical protein
MMTAHARSHVDLRKAQIPQVENALARLVTVAVRAPAAVRIARLNRCVAEQAAGVQAERDRLVAAHAARDADGEFLPATDPAMRERGMIRIDPDQAAALETALAELLDDTVEIPHPPLTADDLRREDGRPVDVPAAVLLDLGPLFDDTVH